MLRITKICCNLYSSRRLLVECALKAIDKLALLHTLIPRLVETHQIQTERGKPG